MSQCQEYIMTYLSVPVKLVSASLTRLVRDVVDELLTGARSSRGRVNKQVMEVEVGIDARSRRMRVVCRKAYGLAVCFFDSYGAGDGILRVEESIKGGFCDVVGDCALVEGIVLAPEVLPRVFVGDLDGADLDG